MVEHPPIRLRLTTFALLESRKSQEILTTVGDFDLIKSISNILNIIQRFLLRCLSGSVTPHVRGIYLVFSGCSVVGLELCLWNALCQAFK